MLPHRATRRKPQTVAADPDALATVPWHRGVIGTAAASRHHVSSGLPIVVAVVFGALSVAVVADFGEAPLSYASTSTTAAILDLIAGLGLVAAGAFHWWTHQRGSIGVLTALVGVVWLSADWIAWADGPPVARSAAMVVAPFLVPLVLHLGVAFPTGTVHSRAHRILVALAYAVTAVTSVGWALVRDPFRDRYCWSNCTDNSFLLGAEPDLARSLTDVWLRAATVIGVTIVAVCVVRLVRAASAGRRLLLAVLVPTSVVGGTLAAFAIVLSADRTESPTRRALMSLFAARAAAFVGLAAGLTWAVLRELRTRRSVARLAAQLGAAPSPGALRDVLAAALLDDSLEIVYWLPDQERYVDAGGHHVDPRPQPAQTATTVAREGRPLAVVIHDQSLAATHDLEREIGAASRLAVDNERLRAEALAQLADLRAARTRIVEAADDTRRQLERNLHDGAQQRLLALSYELQLAEADATAAGDPRLADLLATAGDKAATALVELRDLAHGIFPMILTEAGLGAALATYVDTAPLRVDLAGVPDDRVGDDAEIAAYHSVVAVIERAVHRCASRLEVKFTRSATDLDIDSVDDAADSRPDDLTHIADRVGALGGQITVNGNRVRAVIPCA
jgi:signal transduction histidine kinase